MSMFRRALGPAAVGLAVSCGGGRKPSEAPVAAQPAAPTAQLAVGPIEQVSAPSGVFAVARLANPGKLADTAVSWSGLPVDWRQMLGKEVPGFDRLLVTSASVDFAAMIDPASTMEPHVLWAFSFGVASPDLAATFFRQQGGRVGEAEGGMYRARLGSDLVCVAGPSLGASPARVVCSEEGAGADALSPYMQRGLPAESLGASDVHVHVLAEPFRRKYGNQMKLLKTMGVPFALRELSLDHPRFDRALGEALYAVADELIATVHDVDRLDLDASLAPSADTLLVGSTLSFATQESFIAKGVSRAAAHSAAAPDFFWKLPADSTAASFGAHSDPEPLRPVAAGIGALVDGWLDYHRLPEARRAPLVAALEGVLTIDARSAYATLPNPPGAAPRGGMSSLRDAVQAAVGGHLVVIDQGGDRLVELASEVVRAFADKGFRDHLVKTNVLRPDELPTFRVRVPKVPKGLPTGTRVFEMELPAAALAPASPPVRGAARGKSAVVRAEEPARAVLVVVPDGIQWWLGMGADEKVLLDTITVARAGGGASLATREGLGELRSEASLAAGFSSLASLASGLAESGLSERRSLDRLPHRGETPLLYRVTVDPVGPKVTAQARLPRALVEDLVALAAFKVPLR